mmetsp:Transcript_5423/g.9605  ORF Transcript_5423/g.9605 Transcript_5423/m.9605 type:complete len:116 (-) Transcript_5423:29-376(-)
MRRDPCDSSLAISTFSIGWLPNILIDLYGTLDSPGAKSTRTSSAAIGCIVTVLPKNSKPDPDADANPAVLMSSGMNVAIWQVNTTEMIHNLPSASKVAYSQEFQHRHAGVIRGSR